MENQPVDREALEQDRARMVIVTANAIREGRAAARHNHPLNCCCPDVNAYPCPDTCPGCPEHGVHARVTWDGDPKP